MYKFIKYLFITAFVLGGWALAASSLHVVRTTVPADKWQWLPIWVEVIPKGHLTFKQIWVDTTKWTDQDLANNPDLKTKLEQAGRNDVTTAAQANRVPDMEHTVSIPAEPTPANPKATTPPPQPQPSVTPASPAPAKSKSIFDFSK